MNTAVLCKYRYAYFLSFQSRPIIARDSNTYSIPPSQRAIFSKILTERHLVDSGTQVAQIDVGGGGVGVVRVWRGQRDAQARARVGLHQVAQLITLFLLPAMSRRAGDRARKVTRHWQKQRKRL